MSHDGKPLLNLKKNVGGKEQKMRYQFGAAALLISVFTHSIPLLLVGGILVTTAKLNWCPISAKLGRNSFEN